MPRHRPRRSRARRRRRSSGKTLCRTDLAAEASRYGVDPASFRGGAHVPRRARGAGASWRLAGDLVTVNEDCRMLTRAVAAVFDTYLDAASGPPRQSDLRLFLHH